MGLFNKKNKPKTISKQDPTRQYRYSFSGADARAFVYFEGMEDTIRQLEALHTISISVHEAKGQARALGFRGIKGLARGVRTIGGSMILTVIEDNPLRPLMENLRDFTERGNTYWPGWSIDRHEIGTGSAFGGELHFSNRIAPLLPPTNILIQYMSEGAAWSPLAKVNTDGIIDPFLLEGQTLETFQQGGTNSNLLQQIQDQKRQIQIEGAGLLVRGVEFIDEGIVTSSNDIVTEITLSFIAVDYKPISAQVFDGGAPYLPVNEDQRKAWQLQQKLFEQRDATRVIQQETAIQTVINSSGVED